MSNVRFMKEVYHNLINNANRVQKMRFLPALKDEASAPGFG